MNLSPLSRPTLRDDLPRYPPMLQMVRVTAGTVPGPAGVVQAAGSSVLGPLLYVAFTQQMRADGSLLPRDREPCLADDVNNTGLSPGFYLGRLAGSFNSLPVYEVTWFSAVNTSTLFNVAVTFNSSVTFNGSVFFGSSVSITGTFNFGTTASLNAPPPGTLSKPTLLVTGTPTWTPAASNYPLLWGAYDHIEWEYDGLVRSPGSSSSTPGRTGWVPFVSIGRTPVNDADYTATTIDRVIAYPTLSAPRVVTLPPANSLPPGFTYTIQDESGSASSTNTISFARSGSDNVNLGYTNVVGVDTAYGGATAVTNGVSLWTVRLYPSASAATLTAGSVGNSAGFSTSSAVYVDMTSMNFASLASGSYLFTARVDFNSLAALAGETANAKLTDGSTTIDEAAPFYTSQVSGIIGTGSTTLTGTYVASGSPTVKVQVSQSNGLSRTFKGKMTYLKYA